MLETSAENASSEIIEKRQRSSSALAAPGLGAELQKQTENALARISADAMSALDDDGSHFIPHRYRHESGLIGAMREAKNSGVNIEAEMAHFSSSVAQRVREKVAEMGPAFLTMSLADLDRLAHDICHKLRHDDDDDDDDNYGAMMANRYTRKNDTQDDDCPILRNFKQAAADADEKKKQKALSDDLSDDDQQKLHKETIRELMRDHEWRLAMKLTFDVFLHPLLHLQSHLAGEKVSMPAAVPAASRPAVKAAHLHPPAPKGPE